MSNPGVPVTQPGMITRGDILMLGLAAGVFGSLTGGVLLFTGMELIASGAYAGLLLIVPAAPLGAGIGWMMARRLAARLPPG